MRIHTAIRLIAFCTLLATTALGCSSDGEGFLPTLPDQNDDDTQTRDPIPAADFLSSARLEAAPATYVDAELEAGTGIAPTVAGAHQIVRGGSLALEVTVDDAASDLLITVDEADVGYYQLDLTTLSLTSTAAPTSGPAPLAASWKAMHSSPSGVRIAQRAPTTLTLSVTSHNDAALAGFTLRVASMSDGVVSGLSQHIVAVNQDAVSSSSFQASLNWTQPVDMDLHVQVPSGEDIYWANRSGTSGGILDLDSNAACSIDGVNNENITWGLAQPLAGEYVIRVDLWSACDLPGPFPFIVTLTVDGETLTFEGSMEAAEEDFGGAFTGREITRVTLQ